MELLKERIKKNGKVIGEDILKVDSFLNHQIDVQLFQEIGKEFKKRFNTEKITKILTVEASGIGVACITAQYFDNVPVVFAKKYIARNLAADVYESKVFSYTKGTEYLIRVDKEYLNPDDNVLIIDDFLANGKAVAGLMDIVRQAGARVAGVGIVIEKSFQGGRTAILQENVRLESLARIQSLADGQITFVD
ncbi:MAG: xanthine phosphoribosyltransferase [Peptococcaceae bacterium]|jgi:xanthine phosphoribosyltransferase|nr:xanthine phosphoribosyltransferase [Peptococcaceae bacterium]